MITSGAEPFKLRKTNIKSPGFQAALEGGIEVLDKERCAIFLAGLSNEDRNFLEASEGLGNSQAEVA